MNAADNKVASLLHWMAASLMELYPEREAWNIARYCFLETFGLSRTDLVLQAERRLSESEILQLVRLKRELLKGTPMHYVLGKIQFAGIELQVNPSVLIPRPETEELVAGILADSPAETLNVLDIGTGSGCIALALKHHRPQWTVEAWDVSVPALELAKANSSALQLDVQFKQVDILHERTGKPRYDLIASNPPYILPEEATSMSNTVTAFEPALALFTTANDALEFYTAIVAFARESLRPNGSLWFEVHENRAAGVEALFQSEVWTDIEVRKDLQGKNRMVKASLRG